VTQKIYSEKQTNKPGDVVGTLCHQEEATSQSVIIKNINEEI